MKYEPRETQAGWLIVQRSEPAPELTGIASMFKTTQYLRDSHGKPRRFSSELLALAFIAQLEKKSCAT